MKQLYNLRNQKGNTMLYNAWSPVLFALRRRRNVSQARAAREAGVSVRTWARWEAGLTTPNVAFLESIAKAIGCSPEKLAFEYARLLLRYYCKRMGYEFPALRPLADGAEGEVRKPEKDSPDPAKTNPAGVVPATT